MTLLTAKSLKSTQKDLRMTDEVLIFIAVVGLAGYRLGHAVATDEISKPFRDWVYTKASATKRGPLRSFIYFVSDLISCPFCIGFWMTGGMSLILTAQIEDFNSALHIAIALASTGVQYLLTKLSQ